MTNAQRRERTKAAIIGAAIDCFSNSDYLSVTMDDISEKSLYAKRTIYNYFPTKAAIIAEIFEQRLDELYNRELKAFERCTTAQGVISAFINELNSFTSENLGFMKMFWGIKDNFGENEEIPGDVMDRITVLNRKLIDMPASYLASKDRVGILAKYPPETIIHFISAVNKGIYLQYDKGNALRLHGPGLEDLKALMIECLSTTL